MTFIVFAVVAIAWSLTMIRAAARPLWFVLLSVGVLLAGGISLARDVRALRAARNAAPSHLEIDVIRRGDWWQLEYTRDGVAFTTANELHVPANTAVTLRWSDAPAPWIDGATCLPSQRAAQCTLVANGSFTTDARFFRVFPPLWRTMPVIAETPDRFEAWFANEAAPAHPSPRGAFFFSNSGCTYCHVVRGIEESPSLPAPDLTHFASRRTIAATGVANRVGTLSGWVVHPGDLKPGAQMPDNRLAPDDLHAVVAFLESLR